MSVLPGEFSILTVCTGNICRSPLAAAALRAGLDRLAGVSVESAGTSAPEGAPVPTDFIEIAARHGLASGSHRARSVTPDLLREADLVLALDRGHRREIVSVYPRANRFTVTLREFARLATAVTDDDIAADRLSAGSGQTERLRSCVSTVLSYRGLIDPPADPADDDIDDPYSRGRIAAEKAAEEILDAARSVCQALRRAAAG